MRSRKRPRTGCEDDHKKQCEAGGNPGPGRKKLTLVMKGVC
jgi:hypothetical protein